jgi:hypothetical protein
MLDPSKIVPAAGLLIFAVALYLLLWGPGRAELARSLPPGVDLAIVALAIGVSLYFILRRFRR